MKYFILSISAILLLAACSKKPSVSTSDENILRASKWKLSGGTVTVKLPSGNDTNLSILNFIDTCHLDDYIMFDSGIHGAVFSSTSKCFASDADSIGFVWHLSNNGKGITINNAFNMIFSLNETIDAPFLDTLSVNPLILDTLSHTPLVLDTVFVCRFNKAYTTSINIDGTLSGLSTASFTLNYTQPGTRLDTTGNHRNSPITVVDTFKYSIIYSSY